MKRSHPGGTGGWGFLVVLIDCLDGSSRVQTKPCISENRYHPRRHRAVATPLRHFGRHSSEQDFSLQSHEAVSPNAGARLPNILLFRNQTSGSDHCACGVDLVERPASGGSPEPARHWRTLRLPIWARRIDSTVGTKRLPSRGEQRRVIMRGPRVSSPARARRKLKRVRGDTLGYLQRPSWAACPMSTNAKRVKSARRPCSMRCRVRRTAR
jgi:hypothetical protein